MGRVGIVVRSGMPFGEMRAGAVVGVSVMSVPVTGGALCLRSANHMRMFVMPAASEQTVGDKRGRRQNGENLLEHRGPCYAHPLGEG
jgi:hypothetical protein